MLNRELGKHLACLASCLIFLLFAAAKAKVHAQTSAKKVRMGMQSTNIGFLPFHVAYHKGLYREQGIDLEIIFMATQAVNAAFARGDLDYSAAVNGIVQTIVRGHPAEASSTLCRLLRRVRDVRRTTTSLLGHPLLLDTRSVRR